VFVKDFVVVVGLAVSMWLPQLHDGTDGVHGAPARQPRQAETFSGDTAKNKRVRARFRWLRWLITSASRTHRHGMSGESWDCGEVPPRTHWLASCLMDSESRSHVITNDSTLLTRED